MSKLGTLLYVFVIVVLYPIPTYAECLRSITFAFPTDGRPWRTTLPLDPARQYHITIASQYNLRTMLDGYCRTQSYTTGQWIFQTTHQTTICEPPILFNGKRLPSQSFRSATNGSYYYDESHYHHYVPQLHFYFQGTGYPLTFQTAVNFSSVIPNATIDICDITFGEAQQRQKKEQEQLREQQRQERQRQHELLEREKQQQELAHAQGLLRIQQEQEKTKQEAEQHQQQLRMQERQHKTQVLFKVLLGLSAPLLIMFLWWCAATRARRRAVQLEERKELRLAEEQRTKDLLRQLLEEDDPAQARALFNDLLNG